MSNFFVEKVESIRNSINADTFEAISTYKSIIPRVEDTLSLKRKSVEEVYDVITKQKSSNAKGNDEITMRIIKTLPQYAAAAICHLYNQMIRVGKFPDSLKIARLTPIRKQGKVATEAASYRPISNLNTVEKIIEQLIKDDLSAFFEKNNVVPGNHQGGRKFHSTSTAKSVIDDEVNRMKDQKKSIAILSTDLSAAFDTCDSLMLLTMLEHVGVRHLELELLRTYLMDRKAYVAAQGFTLKVRTLPDCSVIQGSTLSSDLYMIYTLDSTCVDNIMNNQSHFMRITNKPQNDHENVEHVSVGYIDDVSHVVGLDTKEELELYLEDLYSLLESMNHNKRLQINGGKTQVLTFENKREDDYQITINVDATTTVRESESIKILGFVINRRNSLDTHLNSVASKIGLTLAKLQPALKFMTPDLRKRIITAKVKPIATYGSQLVLGQSQQVIQRACALIMRVNRAMFVNTQGLRSTTAICKALNIDEPRQELVKASFSHIHKIIENKKPKQIIYKLKLPN